MTKTQKVITIIFILGIIAAVALLVSQTGKNKTPISINNEKKLSGTQSLEKLSQESGCALDKASLDPFAQCLASKNITMYGAAWCSHCQDQKKLFGESFKYVPYVECPDNIDKCLALGVTGYPTWIFHETKQEIKQQKEEQMYFGGKLEKDPVIQ